MGWRLCATSAVLAAIVCACSTALGHELAAEERTAWVEATAYNSLPSQTSGDPALGAWGDRLKPGMKVIAVSRDLEKQGLVRGVRVRIEGLDGEYRVLDRMASRWKGKIDVYMGHDVAAARAWGRRKVRIYWTAPE